MICIESVSMQIKLTLMNLIILLIYINGGLIYLYNGGHRIVLIESVFNSEHFTQNRDESDIF